MLLVVGGQALAAPVGSLTLHERLKTYATLGLNLVYSRQQVQGIRIRSVPINTSRALTIQLSADLEGTGLSYFLVDANTGYLMTGGARRAKGGEGADATTDETAVNPADFMEEVIVTSPRVRLTRNRSGGMSVPAHELEAYPVPGRDVLRAVSSLPGNTPTGTGGRQHTRGGNTDEVLYVLDGVRLVEPFHLRDFEALFSTLNPAIVGTVDLYAAGFPVDRGSRLAGVVEVALLAPETEFEGELDVNFLTAAVAAGGLVRSTRSDRRWLASVRRSTIDQVLNSGEHDYGRPMFNDVLLHGSVDHQAGKLAVGVLSTNDELDLREDQIGEIAKADFHATNLWANGSWSLNDRVSMDARLLWTEIENRREGALDQPLDAVGTLQESRQFSLWSGAASVSMLLVEDWLLRSGVEAGHQRGRLDLALETRYGLLALPLQDVAGQSRQTSRRRSGEVFAAYVSMARTVTAGLDIEVGVRQDFQDIDPVHSHVTSPRLQVNWHGERWSIHLHAGRYAQLQELQDIDLDDGQFELAPVQRLDHYSLGFSLDGRADWAGGVDLWCRLARSPAARFENVYNRLVLLPELHADRIRFAPDRSRACGLDTRFDWNMTPATRVRMSWSRAFTEERIDGRWQYRPWDIKHLVRLGVSHESSSWNLHLGTTWHSGWPRTALIGTLESPRFDARRYRPFMTVDLHAGRYFNFGRSSIELYFDADNALDRENLAGTVFRQTPNGIDGRSRQLLPIIPNLGVRIVW